MASRRQIPADQQIILNYNESEELNRLHFFFLFPCQAGEVTAVQAAQFQKGYRNELLLLCFAERGPLPPLSVFQPFLLTFLHLLHPIAIFSRSFSWPLMSVCYPLCLALPSTFCHYSARSPSPLSMTSSSDFPTGKGGKKEDQGWQTMLNEEKVLAGDKRQSELFRRKQEVLKRGGKVCAGQQSPLSPQSPGFSTSS